jgi:diphthamide synthase (EF-2-diphthine--ammonia ligase)
LKRALLSWSSGKDCAWALEQLRGTDIRVDCLLTTIDEKADGVAVPGVRHELIEEQARSIGIPLWIERLPWPCPNGRYEEIMAEARRRAVCSGSELMVFGDLFLADIPATRERMLVCAGLEPAFPLWGASTGALGLRARVTCIDRRALDAAFAGREFDETFRRDLPSGADPCGENGEFHTFVFDGLMFSRPMAVEPGNIRDDDDFAFADLLCPVSSL